MKRRCVNCGKLTENWQRVNGGPWHCFDGCRSAAVVASNESNRTKAHRELNARATTKDWPTSRETQPNEEYKYASKSIDIQGWQVSVVHDEDGQLSVFVAKSGEVVIPTDSDIGEGDEWAERFTTHEIESRYTNMHTEPPNESPQ